MGTHCQRGLHKENVGVSSHHYPQHALFRHAISTDGAFPRASLATGPPTRRQLTQSFARTSWLQACHLAKREAHTNRRTPQHPDCATGHLASRSDTLTRHFGPIERSSEHFARPGTWPKVRRHSSSRRSHHVAPNLPLGKGREGGRVGGREKERGEEKKCVCVCERECVCMSAKEGVREGCE